MRISRFYSLSIPTVLTLSCGHFISYVYAMGPLIAEEDLRALMIATNPHLLKNMKNLFNDLGKQTRLLNPQLNKFEKTEEEKYHEAVAAIEQARGK